MALSTNRINHGTYYAPSVRDIRAEGQILQREKGDQLGGTEVPWTRWLTSDVRDRCKELEAASEALEFLPEEKYWVVRLDGSAFTTWTR